MRSTTPSRAISARVWLVVAAVLVVLLLGAGYVTMRTSPAPPPPDGGVDLLTGSGGTTSSGLVVGTVGHDGVPLPDVRAVGTDRGPCAPRSSASDLQRGLVLVPDA